MRRGDSAGGVAGDRGGAGARGLDPVPLESEESRAAGGPRLFGRSTIVSLGLTVALLGSLVLLIDVKAVWREILRCDKVFAFLGLLAHYATYLVRGARWRRSLRHLQRSNGYWRFALLVFFYNFVDNVVPAKLGDVYGAHLARINLGVTRSAAFGSIVFLRTIDAWGVLVLAAVSSSVLFADRLPDSVVWALWLGGIVAAAATLVILTFAMLRKIAPEWLPDAVRQRIASFQTGMWPRKRELATIAGLTVSIWGLETLWILLLALAFGIALGPAQLIFLTMIPLLATAFPLTPSGAGVVELSLYGCLRALDVSATMAASVTVLNRFIDYWLHIALGFLTWLFRKRLSLRAWREVPMPEPAARDSRALEPPPREERTP